MKGRKEGKGFGLALAASLRPQNTGIKISQPAGLDCASD